MCGGTVLLLSISSILSILAVLLAVLFHNTIARPLATSENINLTPH